jgi:cobalt-zinc-cadmium efflux system outer membrane protein
MNLPRSLVLVCVLALPMTVVNEASGQVPETSLTLETAVQLALQHNPTLRAKEREHAATKANEITAGLRPNPTASYLADQLGNSNVDQQHTVAISQPIETGGKRQRRIESAEAASRVSGLELADLRRQISAQVKKAFTDLLAAEATGKLAADNLKTLDEVERVNRLRVDKGDIAELELLRIQVQRFAFERDLGDARQAQDVARIALRAVVGTDAVAREFAVTGELVFREVPLDRERLLERTITSRPDVRAAEAARARARADLNLAKANAWWDFAPQAQYERIGSNNTFGLGISIPLRVFDRNQGEIARSRAEIERAAYQRDAATVQARAEVETALAVVQNEREKVRQLSDLYLPRAARVRETVDYAYRRGGLSVLDLLDAQRTYRETALDQIRALSSYWSAIYQLEAAVGGPLEP